MVSKIDQIFRNVRDLEALRAAGYWFRLTGKWADFRCKVSVVGRRWETTYESALERWRNTKFMGKKEFNQRMKDETLPNEAYIYALEACVRKVLGPVALFVDDESLQSDPKAEDVLGQEHVGQMLDDREFLGTVAKFHSDLSQSGYEVEGADEDRKNSATRCSLASSTATSTPPKKGKSTNAE